MAESDKITRQRKERIKNWVRNPYNIILVLIIVFALGLRIYYYTQTQGQTLWWDEAEYMATAKHWAFGVPFVLNPQRPPLFHYISALAFMIGLGENFIRLFLILVPSVLLVLSIYYLGKEMYDKKVGLIAAFLASVSWTFLFWTERIQPDFISMDFQVLSILFMWKYWKSGNKGTKSVILSGIFSALGFYFKISGLLVPMIFILFILIKDRLSALKNKDYYIFSAAFLGTLVPYFIWCYITFGSIFAFSTGYTSAVSQFPVAWDTLGLFYSLTDGLMFVLLIAGVLISMKILLYLDILARDKEKCVNADIFGLISLVFISCFYIFYMRGGTNDRWVFLWMPFIFFFVASATLLLYKFIRKYSKTIAILAVIIALGFMLYFQISHADYIIRNKYGTYAPVKDAALWIKENSNPGDKVLSISYTQMTYYSERNVSNQWPRDEEGFYQYLLNNKPLFLHISLFEPHPDWLIQSQNQNGYQIISLPYFNSTIILNGNNLVSVDLKTQIVKNGITFNLVYPTKNLDGSFVYKIEYPST